MLSEVTTEGDDVCNDGVRFLFDKVKKNGVLSAERKPICNYIGETEIYD